MKTAVIVITYPDGPGGVQWQATLTNVTQDQTLTVSSSTGESAMVNAVAGVEHATAPQRFGGVNLPIKVWDGSQWVTCPLNLWM